MTTTQTGVLVVGASGKMGIKVVRELFALGAGKVRVTHRAGSKPEQVEALRATGAELVVADLDDVASLTGACDDMDVVVSTVQGPRATIVGGQTALLRAAEDTGVARMIPSDYSLDFFKTLDGGNRNLDARREFNRILDSSAVRGTSVLCGAFMDLLAYGMIGPDANGVYKVWGSADQPYDFTLTDDVAKYIAAVALDDDAGRVVRVAGDVKTARELAAIFVEVRGTPVTIEAAGSIEDLDRMITKLRAADEAPNEIFPVWQQMQYGRDMATGIGKLDPIDNAKYPSVVPKTVREVLRASAH